MFSKGVNSSSAPFALDLRAHPYVQPKKQSQILGVYLKIPENLNNRKQQVYIWRYQKKRPQIMGAYLENIPQDTPPASA